MSFIGIIAEKKDFKFIKNNVLNKIKKDTNKFEIININNNNIDNIKNVRFETVVICSTLEKLHEKQEKVKSILSNAKYLIINSDIEVDKNLLQGLKFDIITYGLNQKATITASSINEDNVIICLQRNIKNIINNIIEINEFNIRLDKNTNKSIYNILSYFTILLIYNEI
jgi:hypothetical protein